jgi:hypothetical protein
MVNVSMVHATVGNPWAPPSGGSRARMRAIGPIMPQAGQERGPRDEGYGTDQPVAGYPRSSLR